MRATGAGDFVQQFLAAGAVALKLFDGGNPLLQNRLLLLEGFDLLFYLLEIGLLRLQRLDAGVFVVQLALPGVVEVAENQSAEQHTGADEDNGKRRTGVYRPARGLRSGLSEKVYSNHG